MAKKIAVMLDGGHLRAYANQAGRNFVPDYIEKIALGCVDEDEEIYRILYYDCAPYQGSAVLPVSGQNKTFYASDA